MERLQKVMAQRGVASRRKSEELITSGRVKVNGEVVKELGTKVSDKDIIEVDNVLVEKEDKEYYLLYKPRGCISSTKDDKNRITVVDLINTNKRIFPIGRLDYDTTGVLLLTNDGDFANIIMHPNNKIEKVYLAKIEGILKKEDINQLKEGIALEEKTVKANKVKLKKYDLEKNTSLVEITIQEGLNHQVKRMFSALGYSVMKLTRKRVGIFTLEGLHSKEYRKLTPKEVQIIYSYKED